MKKIYILMIAFAISFISCSDEQQESQTIPTLPKTYTVSLGVKGEILDIIQTPLTKSGENNNLYGIQVYSTTSLDEYKYTYKPYAYGLFDDISNISIDLLEGYYYKFVCSMVVNGKNIMFAEKNNEYSAPFCLGNSSGVMCNNQFKITGEIAMSQLSFGSINLKNTVGYAQNIFFQRPNVDRYYGEISDILPITNNSIDIKMKRTVFGVKFIATGLTEGKLKVVMNGAPELYINNTDTKHEVEDIFTFEGVGNAFNNDNYLEDINTSIYWEKADGTEVPIAVNYTLTFTRKMMHYIKINLGNTPTKGESPISITLEDGALGTGKDYTIGKTQN